MKTNETKFTPGPWHVNAIDRKRGRIVGDETTSEHFDHLDIAANNCTVARVFRPRDARIIAAVPDLYNAIERLLHPMADDSDIDFARDALAKARGEA